MRPNFISEEAFAEMVKGMNRVKGSVDEQRRSSLAVREPVKRATNTRETGRSPVSNPAPSPSMQSFTLYGQLCSGKNQIRISTKHGKIHKYPDKTFSNWRAKAHLDILAQGVSTERIESPVVLTCHYTPGDLRTRDVTGQLDAIFHLLVYAKVLKDDGLVHESHWYRLPMNRKAPQVTLSIQPLEGHS